LIDVQHLLSILFDNKIATAFLVRIVGKHSYNFTFFFFFLAPYGIREGGRKLGSKKDTTWDIPEEV